MNAWATACSGCPSASSRPGTFKRIVFKSFIHGEWGGGQNEAATGINFVPSLPVAFLARLPFVHHGDARRQLLAFHWYAAWCLCIAKGDLCGLAR